MRLSTRDEMSQAEESLFYKSNAFLDGVKQDFVVTADEDAGFVEVVMMNSEGMIASNSLGEPLLIKKHGKVTIVRMSEEEIKETKRINDSNILTQ